MTLRPFAWALCGLGLWLAPSSGASASPLDARIGVAGLPPFVSLADVEVKWASTPFRLGGSALYLLDSYAQATAWASYEYPISTSLAVGGMGGLNLDWSKGSAPAQVGIAMSNSLNPGRTGYLLGAYLRQDWGRLWLKVAPSITLIPQDPLPPRPDQPGAGYLYRAPEVNLFRSLFLGGPSWLELGYRVTPNLELSIQTNWLSFLKASWIL